MKNSKIIATHWRKIGTLLNWGHFCTSWDVFWEKMKILKKFKNIKSSLWFDSTLKILLETGLNLKFHANLKKYEKLHDVSICTSWNICVSWTKRAWELYESSRRKPGWRFTTGCKWLEEQFRKDTLLGLLGLMVFVLRVVQEVSFQNTSGLWKLSLTARIKFKIIEKKL